MLLKADKEQLEQQMEAILSEQPNLRVVIPTEIDNPTFFINSLPLYAERLKVIHILAFPSQHYFSFSSFVVSLCFLSILHSPPSEFQESRKSVIFLSSSFFYGLSGDSEFPVNPLQEVNKKNIINK